MLAQLVEVLNAAGKRTELCRFPDGTRLLMLPHGGRALGLFSPASETNFYWTNPALDDEHAAREFYAGAEWQNSGGDRTWLAPEADLFFPQYPSFDLATYWQPRTLDPGGYTITHHAGGVRLTNRLEITNFRTKATLDLHITKSYAPAANPLRGQGAPAEIEYAGCTQTTSIEILNPEAAEDAPVGLWNLLQMPNGGEMLVATSSTAEPQVYFGSIPREDLVVSERLVRYRMRAAGEQKIGLPAALTTGRAGYLYQAVGRAALVIRNFFVNPSGEYVDLPWGIQGGAGHSVQACNVNSKWGSFSELEYHVPAVGGTTNRLRCADESQVWAFRGSTDQMREIVRLLLNGSPG